jgi:hypothetical protein
MLRLRLEWHFFTTGISVFEARWGLVREAVRCHLARTFIYAGQTTNFVTCKSFSDGFFSCRLGRPPGLDDHAGVGPYRAGLGAVPACQIMLASCIQTVLRIISCKLVGAIRLNPFSPV